MAVEDRHRLAARSVAEAAPRRAVLPVAGARAVRVVSAVGTRCAILGVLGVYAMSAFLVPTLAPVATTDDWGYARSVEILYHDGRLEIFPVVAATAVFQVVWGALFALLFEPTLGIFRLSTVVMVGLGGWSLYGLCRALGVDRVRAALGAAAYLFNPLTFVLAFTFMTDPHFTSLLLIATYGYARGLEPGAVGACFTLFGSAVAALAFLTRQQGALIPLAVAGYLLFTRRLAPNRAGLAALLRVGALPALAAAGYLLWLRLVNDVPAVQTSFLREATDAGWAGTWWLLRRMTVVELVYLGFFAFPIVVAAVPALRRLGAPPTAAGRLLFWGWEAIVVGGAAAMWLAGQRMPYVGQFLGAGGPGAPDVLGSRPHLLTADARDALTVVCVAASLLLGLVLCRRVRSSATPERAKAGLVLAVAVSQVIGVLPPSYHYLNRGGSLDRYLLPLLPLTLCLALWATRDVRLAPAIGWLVVAAFALFAVAGTRDYLVYMDEVWTLARAANAAGVPNDRLDGGSGWDGYHLYEYSRDNCVRARTPNGPWWVYFYAPATDSTYVVAGRPLPGYAVVSEHPYSSWLETEPTSLFLLRRPDAPWPPAPTATGRTGVPVDRTPLQSGFTRSTP
ncbi:MAG: glycosyltransferase family 39 protein [Chloroflexota bacterium]|nr:glycosyltransferase family 39 protein [Chloroflexota bacterium]